MEDLMDQLMKERLEKQKYLRDNVIDLGYNAQEF